ncbi:MAG: glutaredoxin family protein [Colwellia sp.]|nr:glutaredoxin family protein [Colwellia sp.]
MRVLFHLYSSEGCHLCEQAIEIISNVIPVHQIRVVDIIDTNIEGEQNLVELYGVHIPVLERLSDNSKLFWPFEQSQVVELI